MSTCVVNLLIKSSIDFIQRSIEFLVDALLKCSIVFFTLILQNSNACICVFFRDTKHIFKTSRQVIANCNIFCFNCILDRSVQQSVFAVSISLSSSDTGLNHVFKNSLVSICLIDKSIVYRCIAFISQSSSRIINFSVTRFYLLNQLTIRSINMFVDFCLSLSECLRECSLYFKQLCVSIVVDTLFKRSVISLHLQAESIDTGISIYDSTGADFT